MADSYTYVGPINGVFSIPESEVRFLLGDTVPGAPDSLSDAEISYLIAGTKDDSGIHIRSAAAKGARALAVKYDRKSQITSKSVAGLSLSYSYGATAAAYRALAKDLEEDPQGGAVTIQWSGGEEWHDFEHRQFDNRIGFGQPGWTEAHGPW